MKYHKYILALVISILFNFSLTQPVVAENASNSGNSSTNQKQAQTPLHLTNIIVIAIDDWQQNLFNESTMPRLVGLSQEGIRGKVLDYDGKSNLGKTQKRLIGELPDLYRNSQRVSMLIDGRKQQGTLDSKFNYIFSLNSADQGSPDKIFHSVTGNFSKLNPYFTVVTLSGPKGTDQERTTFFRKLDSAVGGLLAMLHEKGIYDNTMIVIVGKSSDQPTKSGATPDVKPPIYPLIMKGPNLLLGTALPTVNLEDIQATILYLSDGKEPKSTGHIIWNSIKSENLYISQNLLNRRIKEVTEERDAYIAKVWQGEKERERFDTQRSTLAKEREGISNKLNEKERQLRVYSKKIYYYKVASLATLAVLLLGYGLEYLILRKRFLLF